MSCPEGQISCFVTSQSGRTKFEHVILIKDNWVSVG